MCFRLRRRPVAVEALSFWCSPFGALLSVLPFRCGPFSDTMKTAKTKAQNGGSATAAPAQRKTASRLPLSVRGFVFWCGPLDIRKPLRGRVLRKGFLCVMIFTPAAARRGAAVAGCAVVRFTSPLFGGAPIGAKEVVKS